MKYGNDVTKQDPMRSLLGVLHKQNTANATLKRKDFHMKNITHAIASQSKVYNTNNIKATTRMRNSRRALDSFT